METVTLSIAAGTWFLLTEAKKHPRMKKIAYYVFAFLATLAVGGAEGWSGTVYHAASAEVYAIATMGIFLMLEKDSSKFGRQ